MSDVKAAIGRAIDVAIKKSGLTNEEVADLCEVSDSAVSAYRRGKRTPSMRTCVRLGGELLTPYIVELARQLYSSSCLICGRETVDGGQQYKKRYCSYSCKSTASSRRAREKTQRKRESTQFMYRQRLEKTNEAIAAFCDDCTGREGLCRDEDCLLRPVSPLPFIPIHGLKKRRIA